MKTITIQIDGVRHIRVTPIAGKRGELSIYIPESTLFPEEWPVVRAAIDAMFIGMAHEFCVGTGEE